MVFSSFEHSPLVRWEITEAGRWGWNTESEDYFSPHLRLPLIEIARIKVISHFNLNFFSRCLARAYVGYEIALLSNNRHFFQVEI